MIEHGLSRAEQLAEGLRSVAASAGLPAPEVVESRARQVYLNLPPDELCYKIADMLGMPDGSERLFLHQDDVVTVDDETGELKPMKATKLRTWLVDDRKVMPVKTYEKDTGRPIKGGLTKDQAEILLSSEILLRKLPVITAVHRVRLPVLDEPAEGGVRPLRLLRRGFDQATGIYTACSMPYAEDMDFDEAANYLYGLFRTFAWRNESRDMAIHLAALLTMFCRGLYEGKAPMFVYNANIQESGKTTLAWYVAWLIHGSKATKPLLQEQEARLQETLNSMALNGAAYTIFDNVDWGNTPVQTELLDQWISNDEWDFRRLNTNTMVAPRLRGVTMMTGNGLRLSKDLDRRSLMVDLWNPLAGEERELPKGTVYLDGDFFKDPANRARGLAAVWAIVREWDKAGRPRKAGRVLGTFESWSRVIPSLVWFAGDQAGGRVWDCMLPSTNEDIGDKDSREYRRLAEMAIAEFGRDTEGTMLEAFEITVQQFAGVARRNAVATFALWPEIDVDAVMSTEGKKDGWRYEAPEAEEFPPPDNEVLRGRSASEWLTPKTRSSFGKALDGKLNDRYFTGPDGHRYHVKKRPRVSPARYAVSRVKA